MSDLQANNLVLRKIKTFTVVFLMFVVMFLVIALATYNINDPSWDVAQNNINYVDNYIGVVGSYVASFLYSIFGFCAWVLPILLFFYIWQLLINVNSFTLEKMCLSALGFVLLLLSATLLATIYIEASDSIRMFDSAGGFLGFLITSITVVHFNIQGSCLIALMLAILGVSMLYDIKWLNFIDFVGKNVVDVFIYLFFTPSKNTNIANNDKKETLRSKPVFQNSDNINIIEDDVYSNDNYIDLSETMSVPASTPEQIAEIQDVDLEYIDAISEANLPEWAQLATKESMQKIIYQNNKNKQTENYNIQLKNNINNKKQKPIFDNERLKKKIEPKLDLNIEKVDLPNAELAIHRNNDALLKTEYNYTENALMQKNLLFSQYGQNSTISDVGFTQKTNNITLKNVSKTPLESKHDIKSDNNINLKNTENKIKDDDFLIYDDMQIPSDLLDDDKPDVTIKHNADLANNQSLNKNNNNENLKISNLEQHVKPNEQIFKQNANIIRLPEISLLDAPRHQQASYDEDRLIKLTHLIELKLKEFGIIAKVEDVYPGPVITRFEIQPAAGVKVSKISSIAKDLARSLAMSSVRIVEVIPGKTSIGIEVPNDSRQIIYFSEILNSDEYYQSSSHLALALGHNIAGIPVVTDLAKMPHLLVAGTTGSGKSVGVNSMILSMLYKSTPEDVRMIMIDPKMLELSVYEGIPHLLCPVVTDMKDAANALKWCVAEMERRYKILASVGVRNLTAFNRKIKDAANAGEPILYQEEIIETLPSIVVIVDEFADMMMVVGKKVEELIARIAQKARAAGIHLILATQRPSVDVITGLIKANIPTRISFQVSSKIDSRTILDQGGAEQLLGHGDMLYLPAGSSLPIRIHGAFVSDEEVHRTVDFLKRTGEPNYIGDILRPIDESRESGAISSNVDGDVDPLYQEAVDFVITTKRASTSAVQRKFKIGFNRAARIIDMMEELGIVSAMNNGSREVIAANFDE